MTVAGLLLAAGAGRRMGGPKALVVVDGEPLVVRALRALDGAGVRPRLVVLGAGLPGVAEVLPPGTAWVTAEGLGAEGMGASLRTGLTALAASPEPLDAALVHLVDLPGVGPEALARVAARGAGRPGVLARGAYDGRPAHPVLLGAAHWAAITDSARGDRGARDYLADRDDVEAVEVGDVADPADLDTPDDLARLTRP